MTLNDLFNYKQLDLQHVPVNPEKVIVLRHRPSEVGLAKVLPWLAEEHHDVFNAYQRIQSPTLEKSMLKMINNGYIASFLAYGAAKAIFVGLYAIEGSRPITAEEYWCIPENQRLKNHGMKGFDTEGRPTIEWFDLKLLPFRSKWKGKLVIDWPGGERSWWRRAENNEFAVQAILERSAFDGAMPSWNELYLSWEELQDIPSRWKERLREWRGIYYIYDIDACKAYVGSAGGTENILGRWQNYAASGHGSNILLKDRDPRNFRFSILERVSPDMKQADLVTQENSWKLRLSTRSPLGLNDN